MILLITASARGQECAAALERATGERVSVISKVRDGRGYLAGLPALANGAKAIVIDEAFLDLWPGAEEELLASSGEAPPIFVNMAISAIPRIVQYVRHAMHRHRREQMTAGLAAESMLRSELGGAITGILLNSQLALETPSLPEAASAKIREIYDIALGLKARLQGSEEASPKKKNGAAAGVK